MAVLSIVTPDIDGESPGFAAAASSGDKFANDGNTYVRIKNGQLSARTITFDSPGKCSFDLAANAAHDAVIVVAGNSELEVGPFERDRFNDGDGRVAMTYSSAASVTLSVVKR